ncbi:MAG: hypothetical protein M0R80_24980 [Proteobacteria bacterium]|jgi:hypothetical protein|nr:hypothetical protein [Pseudomonadota bacterium]
MVGMVTCEACGWSISAQAAACPKCGHPQKAAATPEPVTAKKLKKKSFVHVGCLVYVLGLFLAFLFAKIVLPYPIAGDGGITYGHVVGLAIFILFIAAGIPLGRKWLCGNCGTRLASKAVQACPSCRASFK